MSKFEKGMRVRRISDPVGNVPIGTMGIVVRVEPTLVVDFESHDGEGYQPSANSIVPAEPSAPAAVSDGVSSGYGNFSFQGIDRGGALSRQRAFAEAAERQQAAFRKGLDACGLGHCSPAQAEAQARGNQRGQDDGQWMAQQMAEQDCGPRALGLVAPPAQETRIAELTRENMKLKADITRIAEGKLRLGDVLQANDDLRAHVARLERSLDLALKKGGRR